MRISDWSSDVCSSDLTERAGTSFWYSMAQVELELARGNHGKAKELVTTIRTQSQNAQGGLDRSWMRPWMLLLLLANDTARDSVAPGQSVSVSVDLGGRRILIKKRTHQAITNQN